VVFRELLEGCRPVFRPEHARLVLEREVEVEDAEAAREVLGRSLQAADPVAEVAQQRTGERAGGV